MFKMFKRITSSLSTAHALILSAIELPDALREVVSLAREHCALSDGITQVNSTLSRSIERGLVSGKMNTELSSQITEARNQLSALSSQLGFGLGGENESLVSMVGRVKEGIDHYVDVTLAISKGKDDRISELEKERDELREKLANTENEMEIVSHV